jgi:hypothetical protein
MPKLWQCPKCKRQFSHKNQSHSCVIYPVKNHLAHGNELAKSLYFEVLKKIKKIGPIKIESLPCCIHFVSKQAYTFGCCYIMKNKIRLRFVLKNEIKDKRVNKWSKMSGQRYLYEIDIAKKNELDGKLTKWLREAYYYRVM